MAGMLGSAALCCANCDIPCCCVESCSGAACGCAVMLCGCCCVGLPTDLLKSCDAKCSADMDHATGGCEMWPDAGDALSCSGGVKEDATGGCEWCVDLDIRCSWSNNMRLSCISDISCSCCRMSNWRFVMVAMEICVLSVFLGGSGSRIFLLLTVIWTVVEFSEVYLGFNVFLKGIITCVNTSSHQTSI